MSAAATAAEAIVQQQQDVYDEGGDDDIQYWVDLLFRSDTDILALSRRAELAVALFAFVFAMTLHGSMVLYSVIRRRHMEEEAARLRRNSNTNTNQVTLFPNTFWNIVIRCWGYAIHGNAALFYLVPLLTLLSYSPMLWIFVTYLMMGVIFDQWSLVVMAPSSKSILKWSRRQSAARQSAATVRGQRIN